jgi:hypothetical protein
VSTPLAKWTMADAVEGVLVLVVRGLALWIVLPIAFAVWLVTLPVRSVRRRLFARPHASLSAYLHWADDVLVYLLERLVMVGRPKRRSETGVRWPRWPDATTDRSGDSLWMDLA